MDSNRKQPDTEPGSDPESGPVALDHYDSVHEHLHERLCEEVQELEGRIETLRASPSAHSRTIISTYERMIRKKRAFMSYWGMRECIQGNERSA